MRRSLPALLVLALASVTARATEGGPGCVDQYRRLTQNDRARTSEFARMENGDVPTWEGWLHRSLRNGVGKEEGLAVSAAAQNLDQAGSSRVLALLARRYPDLAKMGAGFYGPKRVADILMNSILRPERYFETVSARGLPAEGALRAYFNRVHQALSPTGALPLIDVEDLKSVALEFQRGLKEANALSKSDPPPSVTLFGSVFNGRGRPGKSDIDFAYGKNTRTIPVHDIKAGIDRELRKKYGAGVSSIEGMPHDLGDPGTKSLVNPIQLRITAEKVEIVVYPRPTAKDTETFLQPRVIRWF